MFKNSDGRFSILNLGVFCTRMLCNRLRTQKSNCFQSSGVSQTGGTLMSSRNATREDFEYVINCIKNGFINPLNYITHRVKFDELKNVFEEWTKPSTGVIKGMVENE